MHPRAAELIRTLELQPHPEGGHYREVFRSALAVQPLDARPRRAALTSIHFLLAAGQHSRWHRVDSDEAWHHQEGAPLELFWIDPELTLRRERLGRAGDGTGPLAVVPAGCWQAARPEGDYALVGCTVGPGFDFQDFEMLADLPEEAERFRARFPELAPMI